MVVVRITAALVVASALACRTSGERPPRGVRWAQAAIASRQVLDLGGAQGLSGLTTDDDGALWTVPERDRVLVRIGTDGQVSTVVLEGVPEGIDVEAIASLGDGRLALGLEAKESERRGRVVTVAVDGAKARVIETLAIDFGMWGVSASGNQGIEGLCAAGGALVVALETVIDHGGHRYAPVARRDLAGAWHAHRLRLTSAEGKVSGLACRTAGDVLDVLAIERHFGVARLLRFALPAGDEIVPTVARDLQRIVDRDQLNFEGVTWSAAGDIVLAVDNQYGGVTGPNELVTLAR